MAVTLQDIANRVDVSKMTVSLVLRGKRNDFVTEATRRKVHAVAKEMGYIPNRAARTLVTGKTERIAFWSPAGRFFQELAYRLDGVIRGMNYGLLIRVFHPHMKDPTHAGGLTRSDVDGVLVAGGGLGWLKPILENNRVALAPMVNMGVGYDGPLDFIELDDYEASREALAHLMRGGRTRVAHCLDESTKHRVYGRYGAYEDVMRTAGLPCEFIIGKELSEADVRKLIRDYVTTKGCPEAIFFSNDEYAMSGYRGLRDLGLRIPQDVAIMGVDGIKDLEYFDPPIPSVAWPMDELCRTAWDLLARRMADPDAPRQRAVVKGKLLAREG